MNMQAHMSGQISGQVPNQAGTQLHGLSQQHGNSLPSQVHNLGGHRITGGMDTEILKARRYMQEKIYEFLKQRHHQTHDIQPKKVLDIVRRLEEGLFKGAMSQDYVNLQEYMNLETLENRLHAFIKRQPMSNHNQYPQHVNSSSSIGKMIPTPGMSHSGNSNLMVTSSLDTSMVAASGGNNLAPTTVNTGSFLATSNGLSVGIRSNSSNPADGFVSNCYQQSPSFSIGSGGNNLTSIGVQRIASQMIPTPGFNNNNDLSYMNLASSNNAAGFSSVDSTMLSTQHQQKQHVSGHNSHIFHLGSQMGGGTRSGLQQKSYGFTNESLNGGLGMIGNNLQNVSGPGTSEGYLSSSPYLSSSKPLQHFDQHQRHLSQGDGYGINSGDPTGSASGNFYGSLATTGSVINTHNLSHVSLQSMAKASSSLMSNQSNLYSTQQAEHIKSHIVDRPDKVNFVPPLSSRENILQSQQQIFHQQPLQFQQQQQFVQHQRLQRQQSHQNLLLAKNDAFSQPQVVANQGSQVKPVPGVDYHNEVLSSQVPEQFQLSVSQNQFQQNFTDDRCRGSHLLSHASGPQADVPSLSQTSQQIEQILHQHQFVAGPQIDSSHLSSGTHSEPILQSQWHPRSQNQSQVATNLSHGQHVQEEFRQRMSGQDDAQRNNLSSEGSITQTTASRSTLGPLSSPGVSCRPGNVDREQQFKNQQRWLLFLCHARRCAAPEGKCQEPNCVNAQNLLKHLDTCTQSPAECAYPRCRLTKILLNHYKYCYESKCPVCMPVRSFIQLVRARRKDSSVPNSINGSCKSNDTAETSARLISKALSIETPENVHPSLKRIKMEQPSLPLLSESESPIVAFSTNEGHIPHALPHQGYQNSGACVPVKSEITEEKMEVSASYTQGFSCGSEAKRDNIDDAPNQKSNGHLIKSDEPDSFMNQGDVGPAMEVDRVKQENEQSIEQATGTKSGKPKIKGVSLTELFTPEQVREHIMGLRQWVGQSKAKAEKNQAMEHSMSENSCQLCAVEKLTFEPPPIYCTPCGVRIKRNAMYYTVGTGDTRHYFCIPCYNEARGDTIVVDGTTIPKARLEKKKNDEETEEWWVQCDKCEAWQHQICALFNGRRNDGGQAEYTCPNCYIAEVERGERKPLPQSAVLGAKDLPRTILSDHLEQRLFRRLKQERQDRARLQGKSYDEVPGAESLVVRVVSSVDKKLEVKPRFLEIFQEEGYPTEFPYKSKVVLLFQKIEGVEVCLFGMYVQEFGSESLFPNQRRVYLSYLDSVKYFRPEVKAVTGEALRTFVYHEILTGYLEYCKRRGFTSCYIWACPPLKGEDYILYCHPEIQKTPKSDKLREWYLSMLRKAAKENIVVDLTNLYDHFFVSTGECKAKVTAARLPYFDGDYWPGAAEDIIYQIRQEEDGRKQSKKGAMKKTLTKRALKASGQSDLSGNASKDLLLMHRLGETISPMKEDFIMVHLQHSCTHCCILMVSGNCWVCNQCKNFQICQKCYEIEQKREERERHPTNHREKHILYPVEIPTVPEDTKDKDEILESEFFDTRQAFLSLCQGNHYQYDTLRRAKHSSMMVLYHLHNPTAPAFVTTCNACHLDIESGQGWRCEVCPDYDVCNSCYQKDGGIDHPHKLTNHPSLVDRDAQNKEARQLRFQQLRKMLDLLVHASQCRSAQCQYPNCRKVKGLFRHGMQCKTRASGGCVLCKKMWYLLHLHARACKESECHVPRCRDLKEHLRRLQQQSDSRRRAAVNEMMRQRAAELAGNAG